MIVALHMGSLTKQLSLAPKAKKMRSGFVKHCQSCKFGNVLLKIKVLLLFKYNFLE